MDWIRSTDDAGAHGPPCEMTSLSVAPAGRRDSDIHRRESQFEIGTRAKSGNRGCNRVRVRADSRPTGGQQHHDGEAAAGEILLIAKILIGRDDGFETGGLGGAQEVTVLQIAPVSFVGRGDLVSGQETPKRRGCSLIEQDAHGANQASTRLRWACAITASTCSRVTPGNQATNSSTVAPLSRFSKSARTGTRVPLKSQTPLAFPGTRSTAEHFDQSSMGPLWPVCAVTQARPWGQASVVLITASIQ